MAKETIAIVIEGQDNASDDLRRVQQNMSNLNNAGQQAGRGIGGLTKVMGMAGMAGAAVAAGAAFVSVANELNNVGTSVNATRKIFQQLTGDVEQSYQLLDSLKSITNGVVSEMDLMTGANQLMRMGLAENAQEVQSLIDMAVKLKSPTMTAGQAIDDFALMLANQSVERLDSFGISSAKVRAEMEQLLETGQALNREEAFKMATFDIGAEAIARLGDAVTATDTAVNRAKANMEDYYNSFSSFTSSTIELTAAIGALFFTTGEQQIDAGLVGGLAAADMAEAMGYIEDAERMRAQVTAVAEQRYQQEAFRLQTQIGSDERTGLPTLPAGTIYEPGDYYSVLLAQQYANLDGQYSMTEEQLAMMNNRLENTAMRFELLKTMIETEQQSMATLSAMTVQSLTGSVLDEDNLRATIAEFDNLYARIAETRDVAATMRDNEYLDYLDDIEGKWQNVEASIRQSYADMQKLANIKLMSLDDLLGRGAGDPQQTGLVEMLLGNIDNSELRSMLQSEFALLTGQDTELAQVVENEISPEIARIAKSMGAEVSFGMVEAVQNALQTGEFLGMSDDDIIQLVRDAVRASTPGPMPAPAGTGGAYTVQPGDSPWSILANMGIPASEIQSMLGMFAPYGTLQPGMQIGLPGMGGVQPTMPYQNIFGQPTNFPSFLSGEDGGALQPIESLISEQALEEVDTLQADFVDIDQKMRTIQSTVANTFRNRTMNATVNIDVNVSGNSAALDYVLGEGSLNNLQQNPQHQPGSAPPSGVENY